MTVIKIKRRRIIIRKFNLILIRATVLMIITLIIEIVNNDDNIVLDINSNSNKVKIMIIKLIIKYDKLIREVI